MSERTDAGCACGADRVCDVCAPVNVEALIEAYGYDCEILRDETKSRAALLAYVREVERERDEARGRLGAAEVESRLLRAESDAKALRELLDNVWDQFCLRPDREHPEWTMDGGLSVLEEVVEVLRAAGRLEPVAERPDKEWWRRPKEGT